MTSNFAIAIVRPLAAIASFTLAVTVSGCAQTTRATASQQPAAPSEANTQTASRHHDHALATGCQRGPGQAFDRYLA
jgi:hypothetical protein